MRRFGFVGMIVLGLLFLCACSSTSTTPATATFTNPVAKATTFQDKATFTNPVVKATTFQDKATSTTAPQATQTPSAFPLSQPGSYLGGYREYIFIDESRGGRKIEITLWYPALKQPASNGYHIKKNAPVDWSGAPYQLILTGSNSGDTIFTSHLATYGFVMVIIRSPDKYINYDLQTIDIPRDILFVLDHLANQPPEELVGLIDTDHAGVTGYSLDGYNTLAVSGARWNPEHYFSSCQNAPTSVENRSQSTIGIFCNAIKMWDEFAANAGEEITSSQDGLWQPLTDERIRAVAPLAPDGAWFFGERGLAEINIPVFIICGTQDEMPSYQYETVFIYEHLKTTEKYLVSFIGESHLSMLQADSVKRMNHFVTAFFGYYLQERQDYAKYFSEDFVAQFDDLAWGVYLDE